MSRLHIADTGLFVAMGQPSNSRYQAVRRFARQNDVTFVLPERVYEELIVNDPDVEEVPVDTAIDEGWVDVAAPLEFSKPIVSRVMDGVQRYIANADDRPEDEIRACLPPVALSGQPGIEHPVGVLLGSSPFPKPATNALWSEPVIRAVQMIEH